MKKTALLIGLIASTFVGKGQIALPQLEAGVYIHDTIYAAGEISQGICGQVAEFNICLDNNLIPVATGVNIELIITTLTQAVGTVYTDQTGIVHLHDSLIFTSANPCFSFHYTAAGSMYFVFVIAGTPTVPFENYPCSLQDTSYFIPVGSCNLLFVIFSASQTICLVSNFNGIEEQNQNEAINIYPNPVKDELTINLPGFKNLEDLKKEIIITDILGKEIYRNQFQTSNFKLQTLNFKPGIYFVEINDGENIFRKKFLKE